MLHYLVLYGIKHNIVIPAQRQLHAIKNSVENCKETITEALHNYGYNISEEDIDIDQISIEYDEEFGLVMINLLGEEPEV